MQVRKRAKTITFGRKKKEEPEEAEAPVAAAPEPVVETSEKTEEKAETVERRSVADKPQLSSELSETLPTTPEDEEAKPVETSEANVTPANEFVTDDKPAEEPTATPETPSEEVKPEEPTVTEVSPTPEPAADASLSPEEPATTPVSPELSATTPDGTAAPESAFTIQNDEKATAPEVVGDGGKKRFGLYFFLVAFLAFILGLGAMAAVSYGWVNIPGLKLPANLQVQVPAMLGSAPTATPAPTEVPAVVPTEKPADLTAYTISVLNGSGVVGKASDVKTTLTTAGFKVSTTGNADKSDYTKTQIAAKKSVDKAYLAKLEEELKKSFDVTEVSTAPESDTTDVIVTIGSATAK